MGYVQGIGQNVSMGLINVHVGGFDRIALFNVLFCQVCANN